MSGRSKPAMQDEKAVRRHKEGFIQHDNSMDDRARIKYSSSCSYRKELQAADRRMEPHS